MAVAILLPGTGVPFMVVAVFHRPVFPNGPGRAGCFFRIETGEEKAGVAFRRGQRIFFLRPLAPNRDGRTGSGQPGADRGNGGDGGPTTIEPPVLALLAQVKKGVPWRACAAAARRWEVFSLVPMR